MNSIGHVKGSSKEDKTEVRQLVLRDFGTNEQKYYLLEGFGQASLPPLDTRTLIIKSSNSNVSCCIGALNNLDFSSLSYGDKVLFSTNEEGTEIKSFINLKSDGTMEFNGDADFLAGFTKLKEGFDTLKSDFNTLVNLYNSHIHITTATVGATPTPGVISPTTSTGSPSQATIDDSKKENLKCE